MKENLYAISEIRARLASGAMDARLSQLYGCSGAALEPYRARINEALTTFCFLYGEQPVQLFSVSGRTELGGNHTDHQQGRVLAAGISLDILAVAAPTQDGWMRVQSEGYPADAVCCDEQRPIPAESGTSAALMRGVAAGVQAAGGTVDGFVAYTTSSVPKGSGLSSSAAFEVLIGTICNAFSLDGRLTAAELAAIAQQAENRFFGKPCGRMDQMACALGGVAAIDFSVPETPTWRSVSLDLAAEGYALCIVNSGGSHADLTDAYAAIPAEMRSVATALGAETLRQTTEANFWAILPALRETCGDRAVLRAMHFYAEDARVGLQLSALESGDFSRYLQLVTASGQSSVQLLQNIFECSHPWQQAVGVALATGAHLLQGQGAIRVHGGGFAGTVQAYVPLAQCDRFCAAMDAIFGAGACRVLQLRPIGATALLG